MTISMVQVRAVHCSAPPRTGDRIDRRCCDTRFACAPTFWSPTADSGFRAICESHIAPLEAASHPNGKQREKAMRTLKACVTAILLLAAGAMFDAQTVAGQVPALSTLSIAR